MANNEITRSGNIVLVQRHHDHELFQCLVSWPLGRYDADLKYLYIWVVSQVQWHPTRVCRTYEETRAWLDSSRKCILGGFSVVLGKGIRRNLSRLFHRLQVGFGDGAERPTPGSARPPT